jgi:superfamily II DNA or RNA helicase
MPAAELRILLPPNLASCAPRDAIPLKIEGALADLPPVLTVACSGRGPWLLQMKRAELRALIFLLRGRPVFRWANSPGEVLPWDGDSPVGLGSILAEPPSAAQHAHVPQANRTSDTKAGPDRAALIAQIVANRRPLGDPRPALPPGIRTGRSPRVPPLKPGVSIRPTEPLPTSLVVDGSEHFLAVTLPSREHHAYPAILDAVKAAGFQLEAASRKWWLRDRHRTLTFLAAYWERMEKGWGAQFTENFQRNTAKLRVATIDTKVVEVGDEYEVSISLDAGGAPAEALQGQLAQGRGYLEHGGAVYLVPAAAMDQFHRAQQILAGSPGAPLLARARQRVARHRAAELHEAISDISPNFQPPETWRAHSDALCQLTRLPPAPLPAVLASTLRPYQNLGAAWLWHLAGQGLGGVLADEMGLGKTAQAAALLCSLYAKPGNERAEGNPPGASLVVCPASLTENWRRELARFAPSLRVFVHHGSGRLSTPPDGRIHDVVVTSYGTLVRDQELFAEAELACLVADEAQHAKNRRTQAATALRALTAKARFCLTGTPVENSLEDLRSLFDIVLPGAVAAIPGDARGEERSWHEKRMHRQTAPYILRRTKSQVATELPPKIEQVLWCELTDKQRACYEAVRAATDREIDALAFAGRSESQVRLAVLTQLLRLRQICCDPRLVEQQEQSGRHSAADSGKLAVFRELLAEALDDGHRLLVFSQFTRLLGLVREELSAQGVAFCYLDGSMAPGARQAEVDRFQGDSTVPVFLISLKAGGTGLNLTGADVVVHLDPWWNPAAEAQATDRAHRIGQTRVVTSYKLVATGTVEEKVLQLQETKRQLLAAVFDASDAFNSRLELADLRALAGA